MDFKKDVIEASYQQPVLVDFWAPWCGPCRILGPVLEELAAENQSQWKLVKLNTEEEQELSMEYDIRSIPNVKLFSDGKVIADFAGALPKYQIQQWLKEHLPTTISKDWSELQSKLKNTDLENSVSALESFIETHPDHKDAGMALAKLIVFKDTVRANDLVADVKMADPEYETAQDIRTLHELRNFSISPSENSVGELMKNVSASLQKSQFEDSAKGIIEAVSKDKTYANDLPRRAGIALFRLLGKEHPVTKKYRRTFDMWLS